MSPNCDECAWHSCRKSICTGEEEIKSCYTNTVCYSRNCSDLSTIENICPDDALEKDGYVYKRKKLHESSVTLLSEKNAPNTKVSTAFSSSLSSGDQLLTTTTDALAVVPTCVTDCSADRLDNGSLCSGKDCLHRPAAILSSLIDSNSLLDTVDSIREEKVLDRASSGNLQSSTMDYSANANDRSSSSKCNLEHALEHASTFMKTEEEDAGECCSSYAAQQPFSEFSSVKELCISVLRNHGLLTRVSNSSAPPSSEIVCYNNPVPPQSCKICGVLENPLKMLICDLCEKAFHLSCCNPRVKVPSADLDEWYCQPCFRKKPKPLLQKSSEKSFNIKGRKSEQRRQTDIDLISAMLKDTNPYTTGVRIGKDFQAEVPDWSGPLSEGHDYFGEPAELDPIDCTSLNRWDCNKPSKPNSIGNWVQCRAVIERKQNGQDIVCGKWRRAPLFVVQNEDWDCSCSVIWDPIHADCAVPQELETDEVLKHLKYIEMLRPRLAEKKRKANQT